MKQLWNMASYRFFACYLCLTRVSPFPFYTFTLFNLLSYSSKKTAYFRNENNALQDLALYNYRV
ncbi:MAG: hypothetical protein PHW06_04630 [Candidatus Cloacimonas acidaminovorans]|nr:hypothetical protein [Candidatus Cloacimonas acidaminovorans]NLM90121.1 hypothetical protein [Candidatus Cloacimonadota bacterium]